MKHVHILDDDLIEKIEVIDDGLLNSSSLDDIDALIFLYKEKQNDLLDQIVEGISASGLDYLMSRTFDKFIYGRNKANRFSVCYTGEVFIVVKYFKQPFYLTDKAIMDIGWRFI